MRVLSPPPCVAALAPSPPIEPITTGANRKIRKVGVNTVATKSRRAGGTGMSRLGTLVRQTLTIARRDFVATVFTPTFLIFLFAPVVMGSFGAIGGLGANAAPHGGGDKTRLVALVSGAQARTMLAVEAQ